MKEIILIACIGENRELGKKGDLCWRIPEDLKRFKRLTTDNVVIMGRKTYESMGSKVLPNRTNYIVSGTIEKDSVEGATIFANLKDAINSASKLNKPIFLIGGSKIYGEALSEHIKSITRIELTEVEGTCEGADTFFPEIPEDFIIKQINYFQTEPQLAKFVTYVKGV